MTISAPVPTRKRDLAGTLSDDAIHELATKGELISENFDPSCVKQACYELRASNTFYNPPDDLRQQTNDYIIIKPKQVTAIITQEKLKLAPDMLGRILTKGQLFSVGLLPVNTYADPGFEGQPGIVLCNISNNYIRIAPGEPIAKIEFTRLPEPVSKPYRGQHGYESRIWPIPKHMILTDEQISKARKEGRIGTTSVELRTSFGPTVAELHHKLHVFRHALVGTFICYVVLTAAIALTTSTFQTALWSVATGVASNALFAAITATLSWRSRSRQS